MKKLVNLLALVVLVSVNVLTPLSYVQAEEDADTGENEIVTSQEEGDDADNLPTEDAVSDEVLEPQSEVLEETPSEEPEGALTEEIEDFPEIQSEESQEEGVELEEIPEISSEDPENESLIPVVIDSIQRVGSESDLLENNEETLVEETLNTDELPQNSEDLETQELRETQAVNPNITMSYKNNVVTYVDSKGNEFEMGSITITDTENNKSITLLDRNLGATGTGGTDAYGYHFQWGNNYGFDWRLNEPHEVMKVNAENYYYNHPYLSGVFLKQTPVPDNWDSSNNPELWGGIEQGVDSVGYRMQGPCPAGYHVPSIDEWAEVLKMYHDMDSQGSKLSGDAPVYEVTGIEFRYAFQNAFYIAFAGLRNNEYKLKDTGSVARFWTATPLDFEGNKSRRFYLDRNRVDSLTGNERVFGYSVRCFQDTDNSNTVKVSFDTRGGNTIPPKLLEKGEQGFIPSTPFKENDRFLGWYTNSNLTTPYDSNSSITSNKTLYAKRRSDVIIYQDKVTTYTDTLGNVFDMGSITISGANQKITILDRNLGATGTGGDIAYGYHFQWGNNYGFPWNKIIQFSDQQVDAYDYYRKSPYVGNKFIIGTDDKGKRWDSSRNYNLWGNSVEGDYAKQGPCPAGYHVPSLNEWDNLISLYSEVGGYEIDLDQPASVVAYVSMPNNLEFKQDFQETFYIALANRRDLIDGKIKNQGDDARIWASTPGHDGVKAGRFYLGGVTVDTSYNDYAYGYSVRCFKDKDASIVLSYDTNGGTAMQAQTIPSGDTGYLPGYTSTKEGSILVGWYSDAKLTTPFNFESTHLTKDTTIYAKWMECGEGLVVYENKCVPENIEGVIMVSDGNDIMYIRDKNVGANDSAVVLLKIENLLRDNQDSVYDECNNNVECVNEKYLDIINKELGTTYTDLYALETKLIKDSLNPILSDKEKEALDLQLYLLFLQEQCSVDHEGEEEINECVSDGTIGYINEKYGQHFENVNEAEAYFEQEVGEDVLNKMFGINPIEFALQQSYGKYYFRGNNNGVYFHELKLDDSNYITNVSELISKGFDGGNLGEDNTGWKELQTNNPCTGEWEYLPTAEDWSRLMRMRANNNNENLKEPESVGPLSISAMEEAGWLEFEYENAAEKFQKDMLIPLAGGITYGCLGLEIGDSEPCTPTMSYRWRVPVLRMAQDTNGYVGSFYGNGINYDTQDVMLENRGLNNHAMPVRCFVKTPDTVVVTFQSDEAIYKEVNVMKGDKITNVPTPTKSNSSFEGWYTDSSFKNKFDKGKPITKSITLYAKRSDNSGSHSSGGSGGGGHKDDDKPNQDQQNPDTDNNKGEDEHKAAPEDDKKPTDNGGSSKQIDVSSIPLDMDEYDDRYTEEFNRAYQFSYNNSITTIPTIEDAKIDKKLTRIAMAKMLSNYAINVMGQEPDETRYNKFADVSDKLNEEYDDAVTLSYELGIMGINMPNNEFRPNDYVTRGEFATALSRMVYHTSDGQYKQTAKYYTNHIKKLGEESIITQVDPTMMERRGYVMVMLMRLAVKFDLQ